MSESPVSPASIIERASQFGGPVSIPSGDVFKIPAYEEDYSSVNFPEESGRVRLRFPSVGDEIEISRLTMLNGGTMDARIFAAIFVCCEAGPARWFSKPKEGEVTPQLALSALYDFPGLIALYTRWIKWRDSFRRTPAAPVADGRSDGSGN
jgi:hypothetical protein